MTLVTFAGVLLAIWQQGLTIFSPGNISAVAANLSTTSEYKSHADFEPNCEACHRPLSSRQADLCIKCHKNINNQHLEMSGTHGMIDNWDQCAACHPDHKGRDFDLLSIGLQQFDHTRTKFNLLHHQINFDLQPLGCKTCHEDLSSEPGVVLCTECHRVHDAIYMTDHLENFGPDCLACHDGTGSLAGFDHGIKTGFPLAGQHSAVACAECHRQDRLSEISKECAGCHNEPDQHRGVFDPTCESCHSPDGWSPASFENELFSHWTAIGFSLANHSVDYEDFAINCMTCHQDQDWTLSNQACLKCHTAENQPDMDLHRFEFGPRCLDCHDGIDRMRSFEHANIFPLDGKHAEAACESCHSEQIWTEAVSSCISCHQEPKIHFGVFGQKCQYCHIPEGWTPAPLRRHQFPVDHGDAQPSECATCHQAAYNTYSCFGCHEHDETEINQRHTASGIKANDVPFCIECHITGEIEESR